MQIKIELEDSLFILLVRLGLQLKTSYVVVTVR